MKKHLSLSALAAFLVWPLTGDDTVKETEMFRGAGQ